MTIAIIALLISFAVLFSMGNGKPTKPIQIQSGLISGEVVSVAHTSFKVAKFLGIPYAKAEKFGRPQPPGNWKGTKDMTSFGKSCIGIAGYSSQKHSSENCLNLNLYVPTTSFTKKPIPVIVWLHQGLFIDRSGSSEKGDYIASQGNVIVVTINFRLGVFGFYVDKSGGLKGANNGLYDQLEALKWIQRNIASFGGDPTRVTLMGSSSGSISASLLSLSPLADSLFNNVILMSGFVNPFFCTWNKERFSDSSNPILKGLEDLIIKHNCSSDSSDSCLKSIPEAEWTQLQQVLYVRHQRWFYPIVDNKLIPDEPEIRLKNGQFKKRNVLIGVNNQDGSLLTNIANKIFGGSFKDPLQTNIIDGATRGEFRGALKKLLSLTLSPTKVAKIPVDRFVDHYYKNNSNDTQNILPFIKMLTDALFKYPALKMANALSAKKNADVFFYELEHRPTLPNEAANVPNWIKASHLDESYLVFGKAIEQDVNQVDVGISKDVIQMWTNFAKTGNPTTPIGNFVWKKYSKTSPSYLAIKQKMQSRKQVVLDNKSFHTWDKIFNI